LKTGDLKKVEHMATEEAAHNIIHVRDGAAPIGWSANPGRRAVMLSIGYVALYLALDRLSFIGALHGIGITPWDPSAALAMALLIIKGLRYAPLVMASELLSRATLSTVALSAVPVFLGSLVLVRVVRRLGIRSSAPLAWYVFPLEKLIRRSLLMTCTPHRVRNRKVDHGSFGF
jgi:hypothetical protein